MTRWQIRSAVIKSSGSIKYDVFHALDDAVVFAAKVCGIKGLPFLYDATRCFAGPAAQESFIHWKWLSRWYQKREQKILGWAHKVLTPCDTLASELKSLCPSADVISIEDIPLQSLFLTRNSDRASVFNRFESSIPSTLVCGFLPEERQELRKVLMAARKVLDSIPQVGFFFKGQLALEAQQMAANLDILKRCVFFEDKDAEEFLAALDFTNVSLFVPALGSRYVDAGIFTLLSAPAPVVAVQDGIYQHLLSDQNSILVLSSSESIAEGLIRAIQEPLFSVGLVVEGHKMLAKRYSSSSFKHKIRMAYMGVPTNE